MSVGVGGAVHGSGVTALALAPDVCVASGAQDGSVCVWAWADGAEVYRWSPPKVLYIHAPSFHMGDY
jgi:hypothetical protein